MSFAGWVTTGLTDKVRDGELRKDVVVMATRREGSEVSGRVVRVAHLGQASRPMRSTAQVVRIATNTIKASTQFRAELAPRLTRRHTGPPSWGESRANSESWLRSKPRHSQ